ncbi:MAG: hypothetical protein LBD29_11410 [Treponema sp.]|nr:hypothetical protein [Treponema sp.]
MENESHCMEASRERFNRVSCEDCTSSPLHEGTGKKGAESIVGKDEVPAEIVRLVPQHLSGFFAFRDRRTRRSPAGISAFTGHSSALEKTL